MNRDAMYRLLQACLSGRSDYTTEDGVTFYTNAESDVPHVAIVLDALIDQYLMTTERAIRVIVRELSHTTGVRPDEVMRAIIALSNITLVSNHIEERLIRIVRIEIEDGGTLSIIISFNGWLAYHLHDIYVTSRQWHISSNGMPEIERIS